MNIRTALGGLLLLLLALPAAAQQRVVVLPESQVRIDGQSTLDRFTCHADTIRGEGVLTGTGVVPIAVRSSADATARLEIPVASFDCGNRQMNADLYRSLKATAHPVIRYTLDAVTRLDTLPKDGFQLDVTGRLTLAGVTRSVTTTVIARRVARDRWTARSTLPLRMTDFGVDPPTALFGLIRAHDAFTVRFHLVAAPHASTDAP